MDHHTGPKGTAPFTLDQIIWHVLNEARQPKPVFNARAGKDKSTTCSHCDITGHSDTNCFHLHPDSAPKGWKLRWECTKPGCKANTQQQDQQSGPTSDVTVVHIPRALNAAESMDSWVLDLGATQHMCNNRAIMADVKPSNVTIQGMGGCFKAAGRGTVHLKTVTASGGFNVTFSDALYVPDIPANLVSANQLRAKGLFYDNGRNVLYQGNKIYAEVYTHHRLSHLRTRPNPDSQPAPANHQRRPRISTPDTEDSLPWTP